jgi:hypothetical protein
MCTKGTEKRYSKIELVQFMLTIFFLKWVHVLCASAKNAQTVWTYTDVPQLFETCEISTYSDDALLTFCAAIFCMSTVQRAIPEDNRRKEYQEAVAKARAEEEALASQRASKADESVSEVESKKAPSEDTAPRVASEAQTSLENLLGKAKGLSDFSW